MILIAFILLTFIFCLVLAYKTGVSELPSNYYKQAYKYNKESKLIKKSNEEIEKSIKELKKDLKHLTIKLYKNKLRFLDSTLKCNSLN
ncbi:hypothetical protein GCM10007878_18490 [Marinospirillum insulare]|uniref:Uncharacterized protein n=2 Tax=Marinospirillum insulare TaxID=217169 RepID=A0ABQ6A0G6_9GAMM|nr:hypothetical protein GCM10007878_18490 [Marinospirillum insulare]